MGWKEYYESKIMPAEDAVKMINSGDKVVLAHCIGEPPALVDAMVANHAAYKNVEISHMVSHGSGGYTNPEYAENFHTNVWFASSNTRKCKEEGNGDFTPMFFHEIPMLMRTGDIKVDVAMIMVTPPDENGKVSTGVSADYTVQAVESAKVVLAQVNKNLPFTYGDAIFDVEQIDAFVLEDTPLVELPPAKIGSVEEAIGKNCAELINDGDTLQLGIGAIPDAVCHQLTNKKHLGIHSEMLGDGPIVLYEAGAIDNSKKAIDTGKFVFNFAMGSKKTYDFLDHNDACLLKVVDYVNHPMVVAQNPNMVSINACIGVDFIRGAAMGTNGRAIIAMPSVTVKKDGTKLSKITPLLGEGQVVTTSRHDVDYVVTEYGIAKLKGKTVRDRARALIDIAHPDFREELKESFKKMFKVEY